MTENFKRRFARSSATGGVAPATILANPTPFTHTPQPKRFGRTDVGFPVREFLSRLAAHSMAVGGGAAGRRPVLHPRGATGLQQRRVSALQCRDSGCRSGH